MKTSLGLTAALAAVAAAGGAGADPLVDAVTGGRPILEARLRYEAVDQAGFAADAEALTLRTRLGWETANWKGLKALVEVEDLRALDEDYNSTLNGKTAYPVVADPEGTELNRLQLAWSPSKGNGVTLGRQRIVLDDQRFVGAVAWRQDDQTFDSVRADAVVGPVSLSLAWVDRVNRVFGDSADWDSDSWLVNAAWAPTKTFKAVAFVYALDLEPAPKASTVTVGTRLTGSATRGDVRFSWAASIATQSPYADNPGHFDLGYLQAEAGATWGAFSGSATFERLEGDGVRGFSTPLATLHAFNGWADVFLTTPAAGLEDASLQAAFRASKPVGPLSNLQLVIQAHDFTAERTGADLGEEVDVLLQASVSKRTTLVAKFADYDGAPGYADRTKLWLGVEFRY